MARGRSGSRGTTQRRKRIWVRRTITEAELAAGASAHSLLLADFEADYGAQLIGVTVARIRMTLTLDSGAEARGGLLFGVRVATVDQVTDLAVSPTYGPGSRPGADWMTWGLLTHMDQGGFRTARDYDVKAMRKIDELAQTLVLSVENAGAAPLTWGGAVSVLVLLP